jgi:adenosylhomocysteine nucleosidase
MRIGIVAALDDEARTLDVTSGSAGEIPSYDVRVSGPGITNAANCAQNFVDAGVKGLIAWGTAGALNTDLAPGAVIVYNAVISHANQRLECDPQWVAHLMHSLRSFEPTLALGFTAHSALTNQLEKSTVAQRFGATVVDMESSAIAAQAQRAGLPFVAIRAIVDPANFNLPSCALQALAHGGQPRIIPVLKGLARRPQELPALLQLSRWYRKSLDTLRLTAHVLHPTFGLD